MNFKRWHWIIVIILIGLVFPGPVFAEDLSNLTFQASHEWVTTDKLVISFEKNTKKDSSIFLNTDKLFLDFSILNEGRGSVPSGDVRWQLLVDGEVILNEINSATVWKSMQAFYWEDKEISPLSAGTHTIKLVVDPDNEIAESNETDNEYSEIITVKESSPANLAFAQPAGWSDKIVVSTMKGFNTDSPVIDTISPIFVDSVAVNLGNKRIEGSDFDMFLYVNGQKKASYKDVVGTISKDIPPEGNRFWEDVELGMLGVGSYTVKVVIDPDNVIEESDETDNEYSKTFTVVSPSCYSLNTIVSPQGAGTITKDLAANCGGEGNWGNSATNQFSYPQQQAGELEQLHEKSLQLLRAKTFTTLKTKAKQQRWVNVIIGLRTEGFWNEHESVENFADIAAKSPTILQAQMGLLTRMMEYEVLSVKKFKYIPYIAMTVDVKCLDYLEQDPAVKSIEEQILAKPLLEYSNPVIGSSAAWEKGFSGAGQAVAILDTGVDSTHPFLKDRVVSEACYSTATESDQKSLCPGGVTGETGPGSSMPPAGSSDHGTHVAGISAGQSYEGTEFSGVAKDASIIGLQVFLGGGFDPDDPNKSLQYFAKDVDIISGLERVLELSTSFNIASANMSLGGGSGSSGNDYCDDVNTAAKAAIDNLRYVGIATVIASGNVGRTNGQSWPACYSTGINVGSTDVKNPGNSYSTDNVSSFSNSSPVLNLLAPGQKINSSVFEGKFDKYSGTSMAAPQVAGAWAVLKSKVPRASVDQVLSALVTTGKSVVDLRNGLLKPRIQVDAALDALDLVYRYSPGTAVTLTAKPNVGFQFKNWEGCSSVSGEQCTVTVDAVKSVTANFEPDLSGARDLVVTNVDGSGTVMMGNRYINTIKLFLDVANSGTLNSGNFRIGIYLSSDETITTDDYLFASCVFDTGLSAKGTGSCGGSKKLDLINSGLGPGKYFLGAIVDDQGQVAETNEANNVAVTSTASITISKQVFVPIVLSLAGANDSFYSSEMTITNTHSSQESTINYFYEPAFGGGRSQALSEVVPAGQQKIIPDVMTYLYNLAPDVIPKEGSRGGTLDLDLLGSADTNVTIRTTTPVPDGRAGLAYSGITAGDALTAVSATARDTVYICGLRQNDTDRSNVAIQNLDRSYSVLLEILVYSSGMTTHSKSLTKLLGPREFHQYSGILEDIPNGFVRIRPIGGGSAKWYAYGVINDQANSDGSFIFPITQKSLWEKTKQTLPVIVENTGFKSELTVTNFSLIEKKIDFTFVADAIQTTDNKAGFSLTVGPNEQKIIPNIVEFIRSEAADSWGTEGIPSVGTTVVGALFASREIVKSSSTPSFHEGLDKSAAGLGGIVIGARTGSPGGGGQYGLFYNAVPNGDAPQGSAWIYGLQQNGENRSNLALINTGEVDDSASIFALEIYNGETGTLAKTINVTVGAQRWHQVNTILTNAPGVTQGYVKVTRLSGLNPFIAYGVINDGAGSGQRSGDGAYIPAEEAF